MRKSGKLAALGGRIDVLAVEFVTGLILFGYGVALIPFVGDALLGGTF